MNDKALFDKYPEGWEKFIEFVVEEMGLQDTEHATAGECACEIMENHSEDDYYSGAVEKLLTEFFDKQGIMLNIYSANGFCCQIVSKNDSRCYFAFREKFDSRQQAFDEGILKAFEIYGSQLKEK